MPTPSIPFRLGAGVNCIDRALSHSNFVDLHHAIGLYPAVSKRTLPGQRGRVAWRRRCRERGQSNAVELGHRVVRSPRRSGEWDAGFTQVIDRDLPVLFRTVKLQQHRVMRHGSNLCQPSRLHLALARNSQAILSLEQWRSIRELLVAARMNKKDQVRDSSHGAFGFFTGRYTYQRRSH